ncbi:MAG: component of SufBCD complex [Rhodobacteraceae bacterium]|nr:component of SufBCD complex [Paracoccaceae bacterium]
MDWTSFVFDLIDMRSFSNLWYWIALAVTWSMASHWVLGVPWDIVQRARRHGGEAEADLRDILRVNVRRHMMIGRAGVALMVVASFVLTSLLMLGFVYGVEFAQAVFLILAPLTLVFWLSIRAARRIAATDCAPEAAYRQLARHRLAIQAIGMVSIFVTAFWGMLQNFNVSVL